MTTTRTPRKRDPRVLSQRRTPRSSAQRLTVSPEQIRRALEAGQQTIPMRMKPVNDPEVREKVEKILTSCDEALVQASGMLQAVEALLSKCAIASDVVWYLNLKDIRQISYSLAKVVAFREHLDKESYVTKISAGHLGSEIQKLGSDFTP